MPAIAASAGHGSRAESVVRADEKTGHLVRATVARPRAAVAQLNESGRSLAVADQADLLQMIDRVAAEQGVESSLVHSVIRAESNYNAEAVSAKGAQGIMQLIPSTAKRFGVDDAFDPQANVEAGVKYLKFLLDYYHDDYVRAIAAYNAGEGAVDKYKGIPPYRETLNYVYQVAKNLKAARAKQSAARTVTASNAPAETYKRIETSVGSDGRIYYRTP
ncbi:MAG TPA: lytic transglycosylase domain-containing protein [Bryobacteraceae bacterium]|nr:lytic transglycosylase domain-containing protein [Bryobacteraceae bacterium]